MVNWKEKNIEEISREIKYNTFCPRCIGLIGQVRFRVDQGRAASWLSRFRFPYLTKTWKSDLVQTWCMFRLDIDMSESGLRQVYILSQDLEHTWNIYGSDLNISAPGLTHVCPRSESGLEQICFWDRIHTCLSPDSDMSMSKRNMHHVWTRSDKGKTLRCSDLVSKFLLHRFPLTKISKRLLDRLIQGSKNSFDHFFLQTMRKNKLFKRFIEVYYFQYFI